MKKLSKMLLIIMLIFPWFAHASVKQEISSVYHGWCKAIGDAKGNPKGVVRYYAPNAILVPTLHHKILVNKNGGLDAYFAKLTAHDDIKCIPEENRIRIHGRTVINSGLYEFSYKDHQHRVLIPSRFTFVYEKINGQWLIVNHHSSKMPIN
jgi:hypothetical protein